MNTESSAGGLHRANHDDFGGLMRPLLMVGDHSRSSYAVRYTSQIGRLVGYEVWFEIGCERGKTLG